MKLLIDQNLSPSLTIRLADLFPNSEHVFALHLDEADDSVLWDYAREHDFVIVSKDKDFEERSVVFGFPPKVIRVGIGNCSARDCADLLRKHSVTIHTFGADAERGFLEIL